MKRLTLLAALLFFLSPVRADILTPDGTLRLTFTVPPNLPAPVGALRLGLSALVQAAFTSHTTVLFNGSTYMGTHSSTEHGGYVGFLYYSPCDQFGQCTTCSTIVTTPVDVTSIADGTIQGLIHFSIETGQVDIPLNSVFLVLLDSYGANIAGIPITSIAVVPNGPFNAFCFGDGSLSTLCPCNNTGAWHHGCNNSISSLGAVLSVEGATEPDTVVLTSSGQLPNVLSVFLQGNANLSGGATFGDGLRCAGGSLKRLYIKNSDAAGVASAPSAGDPPVSAQSAVLGDSIAPGTVRYYQTYYRDPMLMFCPSPPGNSWNVSSGVAITW